jgi:tetratricopeptide (TPR) repeat protein
VPGFPPEGVELIFMAQTRLILVLLFVFCFSLATYLQPRQVAREKNAQPGGNVLALMLGDARKMFAQQMFAKADAYFHRGNYPSIFDRAPREEENHMIGEAHHPDEPGDGDHDEHDEASGQTQDWIERFGRHFYPTVHVHLKGGEEREMLPWLRISAELDPHSVETYAVTSYWLRERLHKVDEAEQFLRDGLRANPNAPELLYELGRLFYENRKDYPRAKNVWRFALRRWHEVEEPKPQPNKLLLAQLLGGLARIEAQDGHFNEAIEYLKQLKELSPSPEQIQKQIDLLAAKASASK